MSVLTDQLQEYKKKRRKKRSTFFKKKKKFKNCLHLSLLSQTSLVTLSHIHCKLILCHNLTFPPGSLLGLMGRAIPPDRHSPHNLKEQHHMRGSITQGKACEHRMEMGRGSISCAWLLVLIIRMGQEEARMGMSRSSCRSLQPLLCAQRDFQSCSACTNLNSAKVTDKIVSDGHEAG